MNLYSFCCFSRWLDHLNTYGITLMKKVPVSPESVTKVGHVYQYQYLTSIYASMVLKIKIIGLMTKRIVLKVKK